MRRPPLKTRIMYRITRTIYYVENTIVKHSEEVVDVPDIEKYRDSLNDGKYDRINFVYQEIPDDEYNRKGASD